MKNLCSLFFSPLSLIPLVCTSQLAFSKTLPSPKLALVKKEAAPVAASLPGLPNITTANRENVVASSTRAPLHGNLVLAPTEHHAEVSSRLGTKSKNKGGIFSMKNGTRPASRTATTVLSTGKDNSTQTYVFDSQSTKNIAVYYGQSPATSGVSLEAQCADPDVDIVILAFVTQQLDGGKYPGINFGNACEGQTAAMASQAPGLLSCPQLAQDISACQSKSGKKVLLSIGGATSGVSFGSDAEAVAFADVLWGLFGPPGSVDAGLRPFGDVVIDGFDFDNENNLPQSYPVLATTLRTHFSENNTSPKTYYLSSAPQCPFPDASNPLPLLLLLDWVWVQFYNNPSCEIGTAAFAASVQQWSTALNGSTLSVKPRLYIGAPAWGAAGPTAYSGGIKSAEGIGAVVKQVKQLGVGNLGGAMFWDGPEGEGNVEGGKSILAWAKEGLS